MGHDAGRTDQRDVLRQGVSLRQHQRWRHAVSGKMVLWMMDGLTRTSGIFTTPDGLADLGWKLVGPK